MQQSACIFVCCVLLATQVSASALACVACCALQACCHVAACWQGLLTCLLNSMLQVKQPLVQGSLCHTPWQHRAKMPVYCLCKCQGAASRGCSHNVDTGAGVLQLPHDEGLEMKLALSGMRTTQTTLCSRLQA